ncbi:hypothetical protein [Streptomyces sp. NPDC059861]|uniref:hypothetical protein n=1 Tax=Streptomyces sp. NPDC059861 TaxID=3346974 RepID=UPI00364AB0A8
MTSGPRNSKVTASPRPIRSLEHIAHVDDERWAQFGPGAVGVGWDLAVMGLARHLSGAPAADPAQAEAWSLTEEGVRFVTLSSEGWYAASVASGEAEAAAREAADRTTAFYTGAEQQDAGE